MLRIGILYGGRSGEHEVSLCSAASVLSALDKKKYEVVAIGIDRDGRWYVQREPEIIDDKDFGKVLKLRKEGNWLVNHFEKNNKLYLYDTESKREVYVDVVFPVVHGIFCEDGTIQGLLELAVVPYVGADVIGSAVGMDKDVSKRLLKEAGIPIVSWITLSREQWEREQSCVINSIVDRIGFPLFVKPSNAGSSVGIKKVKGEDMLQESIAHAFLYDRKILIEKAIDCREIECSVIGNHSPEASVLGEVIPRHEFYSYEAKYIDPNGAELKIPAQVDESLALKIRETAIEGYKILCCSGMARVDFFLENNSEKFYLNEINTIPGFTSISMYPKLWEKTGMQYNKLIDKLIQLSIERHKEKREIKTD
jgi:D-alanine-D-alanine ligase